MQSTQNLSLFLLKYKKRIISAPSHAAFCQLTGKKTPRKHKRRVNTSVSECRDMNLKRRIVTCHIKLPPKISGGFTLQLQSRRLVEVVWCLDANANPGTCADSTSCPLRRRRNENIISCMNGGAISGSPAWIFSCLTRWASFDVYSRELKSGAADLGKGCVRVNNNATIVSISDAQEPAHMWWYTHTKKWQIIERVWIGCTQEVVLKDLQSRGDASASSSSFASKATFHMQQSVLSPPRQKKKSLTKQTRWINECLWQSSHSQIKGDGDN